MFRHTHSVFLALMLSLLPSSVSKCCICEILVFVTSMHHLFQTEHTHTVFCKACTCGACTRTMLGGRRDEAGSRLLIGTSVSEVGDRVSFEERRRRSTSLTRTRHEVARMIRVTQLGCALTTTARTRLARTYTTAHRHTHAHLTDDNYVNTHRRSRKMT